MNARPLHELLALALDLYERECAYCAYTMPNASAPFMCLTAEELYERGRFTGYEALLLRSAIGEWIGGYGTLRQYLRINDRPHDRQARREFYRDKLAELRSLGV